MTYLQDWSNFALHRPNYFPGQYLLDEDFELAHRSSTIASAISIVAYTWRVLWKVWRWRRLPARPR
jgi:hypothetical protein